jgi:16S rRNA G1207 methylase RsmC
MSDHYFVEKPESPDRRGILKAWLRGHPFEFTTSKGIFSHRRIDKGTEVLIEDMYIPEKGRFLDLGCGYGPVGIAAARLNKGLEVWMTDINARAVKMAKINSIKNGVDVNIFQGHLYEPVEGINFDTIVSNPPVSAGMHNIVKPMIFDAPSKLEKGGSLQMVIQWNKGGRMLRGFMSKTFGNVSILERKAGYRVFRSLKI